MPADVNRLFEELRVPVPSNTNVHLAQLRDLGLVVRRAGGGGWSLSPVGQQAVVELIGAIDPAKVAPFLVGAEGAEFGRGLHTIISPHFVPIKWAAALEAFFERNAFETNVFCMTRFPSDDQDEAYLDPVRDVIPVIREVLNQHGLELHLASDRQIVDDLLGNVAAHIWASKYGIGLLEDRVRRGLNYNVITELGAMLVMGRRCALLKDGSAPDLPSDIAGQIYKAVDFDDYGQVAGEVERWVIEDLGL
jgi:hypothetical protein